MSGGHEENICCLLTRRLTLKMRKDSTSWQMLSPKKDCQNLYGSEYWQVSCGQPTHRFTHSNRQCQSLCPAQCEEKDSRRVLNSLDRPASPGETANTFESTERHTPVFQQLYIQIHGNLGISHFSDTIFDPFTQMMCIITCYETSRFNCSVDVRVDPAPCLTSLG